MQDILTIGLEPINQKVTDFKSVVYTLFHQVSPQQGASLPLRGSL